MFIVIALLLIGSLGVAQELGLKGVGGSLGYVSVSFNNGTSTESLGGLAFAGHAYLGEISKGIGLYPEVQYFSTSKDVSGASWKLSDFAINANVHYAIAMEGQLKPYVGGGLGYNSLSSTVDIPAISAGFFTIPGTTYTSSTSRIGINLLAGADYKMNDQMSLFIEPRYVLASDFNHFLVKVGATFEMK